MTLSEALKIIQGAPVDAPRVRIRLACGFTPLHLATFLNAHLQKANPGRRVEIFEGLFGDLVGALEAACNEASDGTIAVLEWADLDPRLGYRSAGSWSPAQLGDIVESARAVLQRTANAVVRLGEKGRVVLALPRIPLPPLFFCATWQASPSELELVGAVAQLAAELAKRRGVTVLRTEGFGAESEHASGYDLKSDLLTGFPYTREYAATFAGKLAAALQPPSPKKGLITDLDNTLWDGIVGEIGPEAIAWDLSSHSHFHALYQKMLASFAEAGVLIGIASKNDPNAVKQGLARTDLLVRPEQIFPVEAHWDSKSSSVSRILETWNISADSVVFVDDSPLELAEVSRAHPGMECMLFPKEDLRQGAAFLKRLRDLFGKPQLSEDDAIRIRSIRNNSERRSQMAAGTDPESFLSTLGAVISFNFDGQSDPRVLELVNKTNQFNLNGIRISESDWHRSANASNSIVVALSYEDKFGPLGTIAVLKGTEQDRSLHVDTMVMSCRAFSRRIEHQLLKVLFEETNARRIDFSFIPTAKNGPIQEFLRTLIGKEPSETTTITRERFDSACPRLYHEVKIKRRAVANG
jgi:FkbH-like protein